MESGRNFNSGKPDPCDSPRMRGHSKSAVESAKDEPLETESLKKRDMGDRCPFCKRPLLRWALEDPLRPGEFLYTARKPQECSCDGAKMDALRKKQQAQAESREKKEKERAKKVAAMMKSAGFSGRQMEYELQGIVMHRGNRLALEQVKKYLQQLDENRKKGIGIYLCGDVGCGKTHLAVAVAKEAIRAGWSVKFTALIDLLLEMRRCFDDGKSEETVLGSCCGVDFLVLDDLGKENPKEWGLSVLYNIINERYESRRPVILTSNYAPGELVRRLSVGGDEKSARAILDRLTDGCIYLTIEGGSWRGRKE